MNFAGRVGLVTGRNGGICLAMAAPPADAGAIVGRNREKNAAVAATSAREGAPTPMAFAGHMTDEQSVAETIQGVVDCFGALDILFNNAGANDRKVPQDYSVAEWNRLIPSNLTSAFIVSQAAYPLVVARGGGKIVNIGSLMSVFGPPKSARYAAAKRGVVN